MGNFKTNWRRAALLFGGWTLVSVIFAAISYAAAIGENNKEFGFVSALRLNLVQFYLWAILSPLLFRFSRRFPIEFRPLNLRNLLLYFPALISFAGIQARDNIEILCNTEIRKMSGGKKLEQIELENTKTHERRVVQTPAVFSMIGARPCTEWLPPEIERDEKEFIKTGMSIVSAPAWQASKHQPSPLETSLPGIFAAGDVRSGSVKRCAAAVGEGGMAVAGIQMRLAGSS
jgi:hypothetical protein